MRRLFFTENFDFFKLLKLLGLQNGVKKDSAKDASADFSGENTCAKVIAEEPIDNLSPRYDCASALLERHERMVNKVKNRK